MLLEKIKLEPDEKIVFQVRKHWFILFSHLFALVVAAFIPLVVFLTFTLVPVFDTVQVSLFEGAGSAFVAFYAAWLLLIWMGIFGVWTNYYLDIWTLTNKRLIVVDQLSLFHRHTGSFRLERLQNMNVEYHGIIETLLDFGTLEADTAGTHNENEEKKGELKVRK